MFCNIVSRGVGLASSNATPCGCEKQFAVLIGQAPVGLREQTGNPPFKERELAMPIELRLIQKHGYSRDRVFE